MPRWSVALSLVAVVAAACGEDPIEGELIFLPEPAAVEFQDSVIAITLFEFPADDPDSDARPVEVFTFEDATSSPFEFDVEPNIIRNDKRYFLNVLADMNSSHDEDAGDYVNRERNDIEGIVTIELSRL